MPHLKIRGIEKNLIVENSKEIIDGLTEIIGCDRTWFTIEHQNTEYIFDGKIVDGYTFVELYWFATSFLIFSSLANQYNSTKV